MHCQAVACETKTVQPRAVASRPDVDGFNCNMCAECAAKVDRKRQGRSVEPVEGWPKASY